MKIKMFDLARDDEKEVNEFMESHHTIDIKLSAGTDAVVLYEEPYVAQVKKFNWTYSEEDINRFLSSHDVIKVEHFADEDGDVTTIITYKESVDEVD